MATRLSAEIAAEAIRIESRTNLLFSFEKMALRDAVRSIQGAKAFSLALYVLGIVASYYAPWIGGAIYALVAIVWFIPDARIERMLVRESKPGA